MAGLDIVREIGPYWEEVKGRWGLDCEVRVGINTGLVVVGEVGSDLRMEYTAMGDSINVAARMEQTARPGTIQVSADTHRLVAPLFEFEDLGPIEVKGKSEPVQAYRALQSKAEPGSLRGIEGLDAPLIGRDREMVMLQGLIADLRRGGGQIVSVMGDAGLGKSRLIAEMRHAVTSNGVSASSDGLSIAGAGEAVAISWHEARSLSYAKSVPYRSFVSLFNEYFDVQAADEDQEKYRKVRARVEELLPDRVAEVAPFLATLMGIAPTGEDQERVKYLKPPQMREGTFGATLSLVAETATRQPLVLVFEDLHWTDPTSLELIEKMMPLTDELPLMILAVFRPQREEPSWQFHEAAARDYAHRYKSIELEPLDENNSRELVASLLEIEDLPESVRSLILTKAEGNPFYVEEVIRSLLDSQLVVREGGHWHATSAIEGIAVPDTLAGVINARLDRLDDESRRVAQSASVIGREFEFDTLSDIYGVTRVLDPALTVLERRELIHENAELPMRAYMYKHALTQETAYASLLLSRRRELHKKVAECLVQMYPDRVNDIGYHYMEAREPKLALPYIVEAGDRAGRAYSSTEAIRYYTTALEELSSGDDLALARRAHEGLGGALTFAGQIPPAVENYHTMLHLAQQGDDQPMQVSALNKLAFVTGLMQGQFPEAEKHLAEAQDLATACGDLPGLAELHMVYCYMRVPFGQFEDAVDHLSESAKIGGQLDADEPRLFGLTHIANTLSYMTRYEDARKATQEARQLAEELGNRRWLGEILALPTSLYNMRAGDLDATFRSAEEGAQMAALIGAADVESTGALFMGQVCWLSGRYEEAIGHLQRARQTGVASGMPFLEAEPLCELGAVHMDISDKLSDQANEFHTRALALMETPLGACMGAAGWAEVGFSVLATGDVDGAAELFKKGLDRSTAMKYLARPMLLVGSAFVGMARNDPDEATRLLEEARQFVEEREMQHFYPLVSFAEGQVSAGRGDPESALQSFSRGEELALQIGMRPLVWQARAAAAGVLEALDRPDDAAAKRDAARDMINEIAGLFQDSSLRDLYLESATKKLEPPTPSSQQPSNMGRLSRLKRVLTRNQGRES